MAAAQHARRWSLTFSASVACQGAFFNHSMMKLCICSRDTLLVCNSLENCGLVKLLGMGHGSGHTRSSPLDKELRWINGLALNHLFFYSSSLVFPSPTFHSCAPCS
jgi:hypothetical protein